MGRIGTWTWRLFQVTCDRCDKARKDGEETEVTGKPGGREPLLAGLTVGDFLRDA